MMPATSQPAPKKWVFPQRPAPGLRQDPRHEPERDCAESQSQQLRHDDAGGSFGCASPHRRGCGGSATQPRSGSGVRGANLGWTYSHPPFDHPLHSAGTPHPASPPSPHPPSVPHAGLRRTGPMRRRKSDGAGTSPVPESARHRSRWRMPALPARQRSGAGRQSQSPIRWISIRKISLSPCAGE
jgi:hypothetical protein